MTTNVFDAVNSFVAADSRWSIVFSTRERRYVCFCDELDYQKILRERGVLFMFAGSSFYIESWKRAIRAASRGVSGVRFEDLPVDGLSVFAVKVDGGEVLLELNLRSIERRASFAGSGAGYAQEHWSEHEDAIAAVQHAIAKDLYSGGAVIGLFHKSPANR